MQTIPIPHRRVEPLPWRVQPGVLAWRRECLLGGVSLLLLVAALLGPSVMQPPHYHDFADQRSWGGLPHAMDVLSNAPFALWGAVGLWALLRALHVKAISAGAAAMAGLFFAGLWVTTGVSAAYHLQPADAGLVWDRGGMVLAFAGLLGLAAMRSVSTRAGLALAAVVMVLGPMSVFAWSVTGNVLPWAVLQFGGMALILGCALMRPVQMQELPVRWGMLIAIYALAKLLEVGDHVVFEWTGQVVSGHTLKHVVASCAAWPVVAALLQVRQFKAESTTAFKNRAGRPVRRSLPHNN